MQTGLEVFLQKDYKRFQKQRLGILCHPATVDKNLIHVSRLVTQKKLKLNVTCFLGPQHGIQGEKQDNMIESEDFQDPKTGLPVFSLYSSTREPNDEMLRHFDTLIVDLQDIGTRIYTFMYTLANCMRAAKAHGKEIVVLDRPNPIGGVAVEGNVLEPGFESFVGQFPLPTRHGMTMGELANLFNDAFSIGCKLQVIPCKGWKRSQDASDWKRDWVPPSPNIPTLTSAYLFPGTVHFEGTLISEGRGTCKPFEWIGGPGIDGELLAAEMNRMKLPGVYFRPIFFQPSFQKCKEQICGGVQIHLENKKKLNSTEMGLHLLERIATLFEKQFSWKQPPYEYEYDRMPIDLIAGTSRLRSAIESKAGLKKFFADSKDEAAEFLKLRKQYLLYR